MVLSELQTSGAWEGAPCPETDLEGRGSLGGERKAWGGWEGAWEEDALAASRAAGHMAGCQGPGGSGAAGSLTQKPKASRAVGALTPATGHPIAVCAQLPQTATFFRLFPDPGQGETCRKAHQVRNKTRAVLHLTSPGPGLGQKSLL